MSLDDILSHLQTIKNDPTDGSVQRVFHLFEQEKEAALKGLYWQLAKVAGLIILVCILSYSIVYFLTPNPCS